MEIEVINHHKNEADIQMDNQTVAEVLRVYLNKQGVDCVAWRREHPSKPVVLKIRAENVKKAVEDAVSAIGKDCSALLNDLKK